MKKSYLVHIALRHQKNCEISFKYFLKGEYFKERRLNNFLYLGWSISNDNLINIFFNRDIQMQVNTPFSS
jgi:hypothetical protein